MGVRRIPIARKHKTKASFLLPREIHELIAVFDPKQPISYNTVCGKGSIVQAERQHPPGLRTILQTLLSGTINLACEIWVIDREGVRESDEGD